MKCVDYSLPDYPNLVFRCSIEALDWQRPSFEVSIAATGPSRERDHWLLALERWGKAQGQVLTGNRPYRHTTSRSAALQGASAVVSFIVEWVGLEWLERALDGAANAPEAPEVDLSPVFNQLQELLSLTHKIDARTRLADYRTWAAARATLGLPVPLPDMKAGNWDHLLEANRKGSTQK
ncbi:hypothetical protein [Microvirga sp. TS319]|uniref:hypothetical protein n=1 Tax=Microvirga sp. TS319 TaxID=3241165 RepID=UPI00351A4F8B